ncbi:MAG: SUMF1/EgtB/PvdO family nonheme iron enzyme, partial [Planctomycetes bacterium]|nr:SUMF1/EgtB/PvdO family nonheme iron enzyme [Planctomycetota bacterium]
SDLYSLGAILYEILTFRPPYDGSSGMAVLAKVIRGDLVPPSRRILQARRDVALGAAVPRGQADTLASELPDQEADTFAGSSGGKPAREVSAVPAPAGELLAPDPVPPELEEIVLRAMASDRAKRYATVMDLHEELQRFLEGEKERERNRQRAAEKVAEGRTLAASLVGLRKEWGEAGERVAALAKQVRPFWPPEQKAEWWDAQERERRLGRDVVRTFGEAAAAFQEALGFERDNREARGELADLYWDQFALEEEAGDEGRMLYFEGLVRKYNDGQFDAKLKGDGTLSVAAQAYPCRCLLDGRAVRPDEFGAPGSADPGVLGYNPCSGRALDGREGAEGLTELEPKGPVRLKVHGAACAPRPLEGADAWLFRFEERKKILVPVFPEGVRLKGEASRVHAADKRDRAPSAGPSPVPPAVLDRLYGPASPFRPSEGLHLGKTPVARFKVPMGSYLLILAKEGCEPVRVPVCVGRLGREDLAVTLFREGEIPAGFVQVPAGKFVWQGDKGNPFSKPKEVLEAEDFFLARFPLTCREYEEFLRELASKSPREVAARAPRETENAGHYWPAGKDGRPWVPTAARLAEAPEDLRAAARKIQQCPDDWEEDWPVFGVSWEDLMTFAAWKTRREGRLFTLPHERQREKAARGPDGRIVAWGNEIDATFCNMNQSRPDAPRPRPVDSFPTDESPYGARGLTGNSRDICLNDPGPGYPGWRINRGGGWLLPEGELHASFRTGGMVKDVGFYNGGRLVWVHRLGGEARREPQAEV